MSEFRDGARYLGSGFGFLLRSPKLLLIGAIPALLTSLLLLGGLGVLLYFSGDLVVWATPFADGWSQLWQSVLRIALRVALVAGAAVLGALAFVALTLVIGGPFYEHIAETAEQRYGLDADTDGAGKVRLLGRGVADAIKLVSVALVGTVILLCLGFIPVIGQVLAPVLAALFGAWIISLEMTGMVFQRHGIGPGGRHRVLRRHRRTVFGFGLPTYFLCLVPVAQLVVIPSAVVGGTLLAHQLHGSGSPAAQSPPFAPASAERA